MTGPLVMGFGLLASAGFLFLTGRSWRAGFIVVLLSVYLEDPIRKLLPGQPPELLLVKSMLLAVVYVNFLIQEKGRFPRAASLHAVVPAAALVLWCGLLMFDPGLPSIGMGIVGFLNHAFYVPTILVGYLFFRRPGEVVRFFGRYRLIVIPIAVLALFEALAGSSRLPFLGPLAKTHHVHSWVEGPVWYITSIFRDAEIFSARALLLVMLALGAFWESTGQLARKDGVPRFVLSAGVLSSGLFCLLMAARRLNIVLAAGGLVLSLVWFARVRGALLPRTLCVVVLATPILCGLIAMKAIVGRMSRQSAHYSYVLGIPGQVAERAAVMAEGNLRVLSWEDALFGHGLGTNSLGSKYTRGYGAVDMGHLERGAHGGPGAIFCEMGAVGVGLYVWLWLAVYVPAFRIARRARFISGVGGLAFALLGWMLSWLGMFMQTHGALGDGGIAIHLYFCAGVLLSLPSVLGLRCACTANGGEHQREICPAGGHGSGRWQSERL